MKILLAFILGLGLVVTSVGGPTNETTTASGERLLTRSYKIDTETFVRSLKQLAPPKSGESNQDILLRFFKENRADTQRPTSILLDEKGSRLLVRATKTEQDKIETLFMRIHLREELTKTEPAAAANAETLVRRGKRQYQDGLLDSAQQTLEKAVQTDPRNNKAWYYLNRVEESIRDQEKKDQRLRDFLRRSETI